MQTCKSENEIAENELTNIANRIKLESEKKIDLEMKIEMVQNQIENEKDKRKNRALGNVIFFYNFPSPF